MQPLGPLVADLFLSHAEHDEDDQALERVEHEEEYVEYDPGPADGQEAEDPGQSEQRGDGDCVLQAAPCIALTFTILVGLVGGDRLAANETMHDKSEDHEIDHENESDDEKHAIVEGRA